MIYKLTEEEKSKWLTEKNLRRTTQSTTKLGTVFCARLIHLDLLKQLSPKGDKGPRFDELSEITSTEKYLNKERDKGLDITPLQRQVGLPETSDTRGGTSVFD